jgi:hypothetical protein
MTKICLTPMSRTSGLYGPYSLPCLAKLNLNKNTLYSGIYVWGVFHNAKYYPLYVGKGKNICERLFQHLIRFNGGEYLIPLKTEMVNPKRNYPSLKKSYLKNKTLSKELLHFPIGSFDFDSFDKNTDIIHARQFVRKKLLCLLESNSKLYRQIISYGRR